MGGAPAGGGGAAPAAAAKPGRPSVGDSVRLVHDRPEIAGKCLGLKHEGKVGKLLKDDGSNQPFKVVFEGNENW